MQPDLKWVLPIERMANQKPMDIVAHPDRFADRDAVYQNKRKLHLSSKVFMNGDYCKNTVEERKSQTRHSGTREVKRSLPTSAIKKHHENLIASSAGADGGAANDIAAATTVDTTAADAGAAIKAICDGLVSLISAPPHSRNTR